jgi:hypothetical protein
MAQAKGRANHEARNRTFVSRKSRLTLSARATLIDMARLWLRLRKKKNPVLRRMATKRKSKGQFLVRKVTSCVRPPFCELLAGTGAPPADERRLAY